MRLTSIQALRGFAALLVFAYHLSFVERDAIAANGLSETALVGGLWTNGYAGVDLFFVISGFIMVFVTGAATPSGHTSGAFLFARAARIYPLWWIFATAMALYYLSVYGIPYDVEREMHGQVLDQNPALHLFYSYMLLPQGNWPVLGVGWTLVHELYFYVVFAAFLLLPRRYLPALLAGWAFVVTGGWWMGWSGVFANDLPALIFYPMTIEFILGAFVGLAVVNGWRFRPRLISSLAAVAFVIALALQGAEDEALLQWGRVLWYGVPCALVVYGVACLDIVGEWRMPKIFTDIGDWSYALYLSHMLTLSALRRALPEAADSLEALDGPIAGLAPLLRVGTPGLADNIVFLVLAIVTTLAVAWASHRYLERPLLRLAGKMRAGLFDASRTNLRPLPLRASVW
ncbi:MAG: acyltransferase [Pseudomonadota bacterium]